MVIPKALLIALVSLATSVLGYDLELLFGNLYPVKYCNWLTTPYTCENTTSFSNQCCFEKDGLMLQTQFWDYNTSLVAVAINGTDEQKSSVESNAILTYQSGIGYFGIGQWLEQIWQDITTDTTSSMPIEKAFTIHGLWSDRCDGSYEQFCQPDLEIPDSENITDIIVNKFNKPELYNLMQKYWINTADSNVASDSNIELWKHEYDKHATCMTTVNPSCFIDDYQQFEAAVLFWQKVTQIWDKLNTYEFLSKSGIFPTVKHSYKLTDIQEALKKSHGGKEVFIGCSKQGVLNEVWYYHLLKGSVFTGNYKAEDSTTVSTCPENVWYLPK